jgi:acyl-CoA hydrolase
MPHDRLTEDTMSGRQRSLQFRFLAEPTDVNYGGKVHGGAVMKWIDQAGYAAAVGWSGRYCVTVAVDGIRFLAPIRIGELVTVAATLLRTGTSSMQFALEVRARAPAGEEADARLCVRCVIAFVALDAVEGKPAPVPPLADADPRLAEQAARVMALGRDIEQAIAALEPAPAADGPRSAG